MLNNNTLLKLLNEESFYEYFSKQDEEIICELFAEYEAACGRNNKLLPMWQFNDYFACYSPLEIAEMVWYAENFDCTADYFMINDDDYLDIIDCNGVYEEFVFHVDSDLLEKMPKMKKMLECYYNHSDRTENSNI